MRIPGYNKIKTMLKKRIMRVLRFCVKVILPERFPCLKDVELKRFSLDLHQDNLVIIEGIVSIASPNDITRVMLMADKNQLGEIVLNPIETKCHRGSVKRHEFSFLHFALSSADTKIIRIISQKTQTTIGSFKLQQNEIFPFQKPFIKPKFLTGENSAACPKNQYPPEVDSKKMKRPLKVLLFTHSLNIEGAPKVLLEIAKGLSENKSFTPLVFSPLDGPLKADMQNLNIPFIFFPDQIQHKNSSIAIHDTNQLNNLLMLDILESEKPDVVFANTIVNSSMVSAAHHKKIPCVWMIHESSYPAVNQDMTEFCSRSENLKAFMLASRIVFCAESTQNIYKHFDFNHRFAMVKNDIENKFEALQLNDELKAKARQKLNIPHQTITLLNVGLIHANKNQLLIIKALRHIQNKNFMLFLVGARNGFPYIEQIQKAIVDDGLDGKVIVVPEQKDILNYYLAADIYILPSLSESYPLTILEAMACGLPILATPVYGVSEQVKFGLNALSISPSNENDLAEKINLLINDTAKRQSMGRNSRKLYDEMPGLTNMVNEHARILFSAWKSGIKQAKNVNHAK